MSEILYFLALQEHGHYGYYGVSHNPVKNTKSKITQNML